MFNFFIFLGMLSVILAIVTMGMFLLKMKFLQKYSFIKKISPYLFKNHKYLGRVTIFFSSVHGFGMLYLYKNNLNQNFIWAGVLALTFFYFTGVAAFTMRHISSDKKIIFLKLHRFLGISLLFFIFLHLSLI